MQYDIDGVLIGHDGELEISARVRVHDATVTIHAFGSGHEKTIRAQKPAAMEFVETLASELLGGATVPHQRRKTPDAVLCPDCLGIEPEVWDCETCRGGGNVPG